jgi:hypothetical protein
MLKTTNLIGFGGGVSDTGPQTVALSSNDWDYAFDSGNEHPVAGNPLGDHTIGAYFKATGSDNNISTLVTLDGDFDITFTLAETNQSEFGVYAMDEDGTRNADQRANMDGMTNSFWYRDETYTDFAIGSSYQSDTHTFADGSVVKIERRLGTIKVYDDDVLVHTYGTTYSGTMRFAKGDPGPAEADYDDFKIVDYAKIQREGQINEGISGSDSCGDANASKRYAGFQFTATRTGTVTEAKVKYASVGTAYNATIDIYTDNSGSPGSIIGSASDSTSNSGGGTITYPNISASVNKGTTYWAILNDVTGGGSGNASLGKLTGNTLYGSGLHDTITSITDNATAPYPFEIVIDTSAGEPIPDHDTLLLIHSNTTDGSTTFTDSSQFGRTLTRSGTSMTHSTTEQKFGTTSMKKTSAADYLYAADSDDWKFGSNDFTIDFWIKNNGNVNFGVMSQHTGSGASQTSFDIYVGGAGGKLKCAASNGSSFMVDLASSSDINDNAWHHCAFVRARNSFGLWIDGTSEATGTGSGNMPNISANVEIGQSGQTGTTGFVDYIDEIRISRVARWEPGTNFTSPTSAYS